MSVPSLGLDGTKRNPPHGGARSGSRGGSLEPELPLASPRPPLAPELPLLAPPRHLLMPSWPLLAPSLSAAASPRVVASPPSAAAPDLDRGEEPLEPVLLRLP
ncbi:hypothetical protein VPH35_138720 [Triticum aestivum]